MGLPLTASDPATATRYDEAVAALLHLAPDVGDRWSAAVADEPDFALGAIGAAYLACLSSEGADAAAARSLLDGVDEGRSLTSREQRHLAAAGAFARGDLHGAAARLAALTAEHPHDALALAVGHQLDFFTGDATMLRDRIGAALESWDPADPWVGYLHGMHAFGLEECGQYDDAIAEGVTALEREPGDSWAHHAVVHVHEMRGDFRRGLRFIDERRSDWSEGNFLVVHNSWHEALFQLEAGDVEAPLAIYDTVLHHAGSANVAMEMLDASALLWRLHLEGLAVGDRWPALAEAWATKVDEPWYVFNDVHAVMAFVGADRLVDARAVIDRLARVAAIDDPTVSNAAMTAEVGLPVAQALLDFGEERYEAVVDGLLPRRDVIHHFGGSHAQRDAIARTLVEAALRAGDLETAARLLEERLAVRDSSPYTWSKVAALRSARGDEAGAAEAWSRVARLRLPET